MVGKGLYINIGLTPLDTSEIQVRRMVEVSARPCAVENSSILCTICWQIFFDNHSKIVHRSWMSGEIVFTSQGMEGNKETSCSGRCHQHNISKQRSIASHVNRNE